MKPNKFTIGVSLAATALAGFTDQGRCAEKNSIPYPLDEWKGVQGKTLADSKPDFIGQKKAPKGAPNVLIIMLDDAGYSNATSYGGVMRTPTFDRIGDDHHRFVDGSRGRLVRSHNVGQRMTVNDDGLPAEGRETPVVCIEIAPIHRLPTLSQPVDVQHTDEIVQPVVDSNLNRLPLRTLGHLAITQQNVGAVWQLIKVLGIQRHTDPDSQPLPQRTRGCLGIGK